MLEAYIYIAKAMASLLLSAFEDFLEVKGRKRVLSVSWREQYNCHELVLVFKAADLQYTLHQQLLPDLTGSLPSPLCLNFFCNSAEIFVPSPTRSSDLACISSLSQSATQLHVALCQSRKHNSRQEKWRKPAGLFFSVAILTNASLKHL